MLKGYILQNWALFLILFAFAIILHTTVFMDRTTIRRMYILILGVFLLSIIVYVEFHLVDLGGYRILRTVLMAIRYSATPFIIALVTYTLVKQFRWFIFIPAIILAAIDFISIFTGTVFSVDAAGVFHRGPLGLLPYIVVGLYCVFLIYILFKRSNKQSMEIIPIAFLCFALGSGVLLPFVLGSAYANIFCTTIAISLFVYYVFSILQLTKKDALTGLLNRQAYYADISTRPEDISAMVSLDMNGLKTINDTRGHAAGDDALVTLSLCLNRALKRRQSAYRVGGDEFVIVCRKTTHIEVLQLVERIRNSVAETACSCSIGYSSSEDGTKSPDVLLSESDRMMYEEKAEYYGDSNGSRLAE